MTASLQIPLCRLLGGQPLDLAYVDTVISLTLFVNHVIMAVPSNSLTTGVEFSPDL